MPLFADFCTFTLGFSRHVFTASTRYKYTCARCASAGLLFPNRSVHVPCLASIVFSALLLWFYPCVFLPFAPNFVIAVHILHAQRATLVDGAHVFEAISCALLICSISFLSASAVAKQYQTGTALLPPRDRVVTREGRVEGAIAQGKAFDHGQFKCLSRFQTFCSEGGRGPALALAPTE